MWEQSHYKTNIKELRSENLKVTIIIQTQGKVIHEGLQILEKMDMHGLHNYTMYE